MVDNLLLTIELAFPELKLMMELDLSAHYLEFLCINANEPVKDIEEKKKKSERSLQSIKLLPISYKVWYTSIEIVVTDPTAISREKKLQLQSKFREVLSVFLF